MKNLNYFHLGMVLCVSNSIGGEENQEFEYILGFMSKSLSPNKGTNISEQKRCRKNVTGIRKATRDTPQLSLTQW